jgi:hypothetical protein
MQKDQEIFCHSKCLRAQLHPDCMRLIKLIWLPEEGTTQPHAGSRSFIPDFQAAGSCSV